MEKVVIDKSKFIAQKGNIKDHYVLDETKIIWQNESGYLIRCQEKSTKVIRAVKIIYKYCFSDMEGFCKEVDKLKEFDHPNITRLYDYFDDEKNFYVVHDLCLGGELLDRISDMGSISESTSAKIFKQMVEAIAYCNSKGLYHRDLTPKSFMFLKNEPDSPLILVDLGFARMLKTRKKGKLAAFRGDPYYISPEQIDGKISAVSNMWSLGAILYLMLTGSPPFTGSSTSRILEAVKEMRYSFELSIWSDVSHDCKNLIAKLLKPKEQRLTAAKVLAHPWLVNKAKDAKPNLTPAILANIKSFQNSQKLKKAVMTFIATRLSEKELAPLRALFKSLDKNSDGRLSEKELKEGFKGMKDEDELSELMNALDTDHSGYIEYNEFLAAAMGEHIGYYKERAEEAFSMFDKDQSGKISAKELQRIVREQCGEKEAFWLKIINDSDKNGDGELDVNEFLGILNKVNS